MLNLNEIAAESKTIKEKRIENGATIREDSLKHCAEELVEAAQAREIYFYHTWINNNDAEYIKSFNSFAEELADVVICVLTEVAERNIDIEDAIRRKMEKNRNRALGLGDKD